MCRGLVGDNDTSVTRAIGLWRSGPLRLGLGGRLEITAFAGICATSAILQRSVTAV